MRGSAAALADDSSRHADVGLRLRLAAALRLSGARAQLGLYSISGPITAAHGDARFVLPELLPPGLRHTAIVGRWARIGRVRASICVRRLKGRVRRCSAPSRSWPC